MKITDIRPYRDRQEELILELNKKVIASGNTRPLLKSLSRRLLNEQIDQRNFTLAFVNACRILDRDDLLGAPYEKYT